MNPNNYSSMATKDKDTDPKAPDDEKPFLPQGKTVKDWADDEDEKPQNNNANNNNNNAGANELADKVKNLQVPESKDEDST